MDIYSLLPYKKRHVLHRRAEKINLLKLWHAICLELQETLISFQKKDTEVFDAPVGDTLCQIRAHMLFKLSLKPQKKYGIFIEFLEPYIQYLDLCIQQYECCSILSNSFIKKLDGRESLTHFFSSNYLEFVLDKDICFLFYSFFLKKFSLKNSEGNPDHINYKEVSLKLSVTTVRSRRLTHYYQFCLSQYSCRHITSVAKQLYSDKLVRFINSQIMHGDRNRQVLPTYIVTKTILDEMNLSKQKIVLSIYDQNNRELLLEYRFTENKLITIEDKSQYYKKNCLIVFEGWTKFDLSNKEFLISSLLKIGIYNILLSSMANHPQYVGITLEKYRWALAPVKRFINELKVTEYIKKYEHFVELSKKHGTGRSDIRLFCIRHIFSKGLAINNSPKTLNINHCEFINAISCTEKKLLAE